MDRILQVELQQKALRESLWLALFCAQLCGFHEIQSQLTAMLAHVDDLRQLPRDEHGDFVDGVATFGPEIADRIQGRRA